MTTTLVFSFDRTNKQGCGIKLLVFKDDKKTQIFLNTKAMHADHPHALIANQRKDGGCSGVSLKYIMMEEEDDETT